MYCFYVTKEIYERVEEEVFKDIPEGVEVIKKDNILWIGTEDASLRSKVNTFYVQTKFRTLQAFFPPTEQEIVDDPPFPTPAGSVPKSLLEKVEEIEKEGKVKVIRSSLSNDDQELLLNHCISSAIFRDSEPGKEDGDFLEWIYESFGNEGEPLQLIEDLQENIEIGVKNIRALIEKVVEQLMEKVLPPKEDNDE